MKPWAPVSRMSAAAVTGGVLGLAGLHGSSPDRWIRILDDANLAFHEAGHVLFGLFGPTLGLWGGTFGQLLFPAVTTFLAWRKREPIAATVCGLWFFENFLNIGRYMADARAQILPLVGGGDHDWARLLGSWRLLPYDNLLGGLVGAAGWIGIAACVAWIWRQALIRAG